jgi:hypothetical protein
MFADVDCSHCRTTFRCPLHLPPLEAACPQCGVVTKVEKPIPSREPTTAIRDEVDRPAIHCCPACSGHDLRHLVMRRGEFRERKLLFGFIPFDEVLQVNPLVCLDCGYVAFFVDEANLEKLRRRRG